MKDDLVIFGGYCDNINRLSKAKLAKNELPTLQNISYKEGKGWAYTFSPYNMSDVYEALHLCRPFFLSREPFSFEKVLALIGKRFDGEYVRRNLQGIRNLYEDGENRSYFNFSVNNISLFDRGTFKAWLNGVEYHQDPDKKRIIDILSSALSEEAARGFFVSHLTDRIRALYLVNNTVKVVLKKYHSM